MIKHQDVAHYVSDSFTDPTSRGGPLGTEDEMPDGGDSTRGMSKGPASKSPMPEPISKADAQKRKAAG